MRKAGRHWRCSARDRSGFRQRSSARRWGHASSPWRRTRSGWRWRSNFGASDLVDASKDDVVKALKDLTRGEGVDLALECSSAAAARQAAVRAVRTWGTACFVGEGGDVTLDVSPDLLRRQVTLIGSWTFSATGMGECARFVADNGIKLDRIFTHRWKLDQANEGLQGLRCPVFRKRRDRVLAVRGALRVDVERIERGARRHEQAVAVHAAETKIGAALGQVDATDQLAGRIEYVHAIEARFAHAPAAPQVAVDVHPEAVWCSLGPSIDEGSSIFNELSFETSKARIFLGTARDSTM
jgi:hypothetical protein